MTPLRLYFVDEDVGVVQPLLLLSNPSSFDEILEIRTGDMTAIGKSLCYHNLYII